MTSERSGVTTKHALSMLTLCLQTDVHSKGEDLLLGISAGRVSLTSHDGTVRSAAGIILIAIRARTHIHATHAHLRLRTLTCNSGSSCATRLLGIPLPTWLALDVYHLFSLGNITTPPTPKLTCQHCVLDSRCEQQAPLLLCRCVAQCEQ